MVQLFFCGCDHQLVGFNRWTWHHPRIVVASLAMPRMQKFLQVVLPWKITATMGLWMSIPNIIKDWSRFASQTAVCTLQYISKQCVAVALDYEPFTNQTGFSNAAATAREWTCPPWPNRIDRGAKHGHSDCGMHRQQRKGTATSTQWHTGYYPKWLVLQFRNSTSHSTSGSGHVPVSPASLDVWTERIHPLGSRHGFHLNLEVPSLRALREWANSISPMLIPLWISPLAGLASSCIHLGLTHSLRQVKSWFSAGRPTISFLVTKLFKHIYHIYIYMYDMIHGILTLYTRYI